MSEKFKALLAELDLANTNQEPLAKSMAAVVEPDPAAVAAAAAAAAAVAAPAILPNPEDAANGGVLAKAISETEALLAAAAPVVAEQTVVIDGEEIFKSLEAIGGRQTETEETLTKSVTALLGLAKKQDLMIKSLSERLDVLGGTGAGRKTAIQVHERPALGGELAKSQPGGMSAPEILAKANAAWDAKKITGQEFTALDVSLRNGQVPSTDTLTKILS